MDELARMVLIAWARSEGFADVHNGQVVAYLDSRGFMIVARDAEPFDWTAFQKLRKSSP
jgi:hypothetical protein